MRVGRVDSVSLDGTVAKVKFTLNRSQPVLSNTKIAIRYQNLIGQRFLALLPGAGTAAALPSGSRIPQASTEDALDLTVVINGFQPLFNVISPQDINKLSASIVSVLQGEGGSLVNLLKTASDLTGHLADHDQLIGQVIDNFAAVLSDIGQRNTQVDDLIGQLHRLVAATAADRDQIGGSIDALSGLTSATTALLRNIRAAVEGRPDPLGPGGGYLRVGADRVRPGRAGPAGRVGVVRPDHAVRVVDQPLSLQRLLHRRRYPAAAVRGQWLQLGGVQVTRLWDAVRRFATTRSPRFIGAITVVLVASVVAALFVPSGFAFGKTTYHAELTEAGGLATGDEVRVAGVSVGKVSHLHVTTRALVLADFRIDTDVHLGNATTAEVKVATLLGNHFLSLNPAGTGVLPNRTIPLASTTVPFEVQDITEAGGTALEQLDGAKLQAALKVLADDFRGTPALTGQAFANISRLSDVIVKRRGELNTLIKEADAVTANLNANRDTLVDLMKQAALILDAVAKRRVAITALLTESRDLADQLTGLVRDNKATIGPMLAHLNVVLGVLKDNDAALNQIGILLGPAARYFASATGNGPYLDIGLVWYETP